MGPVPALLAESRLREPDHPLGGISAHVDAQRLHVLCGADDGGRIENENASDDDMLRRHQHGAVFHANGKTQGVEQFVFARFAGDRTEVKHR